MKNGTNLLIFSITEMLKPKLKLKKMMLRTKMMVKIRKKKIRKKLLTKKTTGIEKVEYLIIIKNKI